VTKKKKNTDSLQKYILDKFSSIITLLMQGRIKRVDKLQENFQQKIKLIFIKGKLHVRSMSTEFIFSAVFKKEAEGGYSAFCPELGVASQGETIEEAEANLKEACELYIESAKELV
jgi:predicted RNase H-like HicB family nuclease